MTEHSPNTKQADLRDLVSPIWRRRWLILAIVVVSTTATYVASSHQDKRYRAQTRVFVSASVIQAILNGPSGGTDRDTQDQAQLMTSRPVAKAVIKRLRLAETPNALQSTVTATATTGSNFVLVSAERASGAQAADVANAFVKEYVVYRGERLQQDVDPAISQARAQLSKLPTGLASAQQRQDLRSRITQLESARDVAPSQARQTDPAVAPTQPFSPRPKRDALFGLIIALVLALALAFNLDRFDRRIKRPDDISDIYGVPLLSVIPHTDRSSVLRDDMAVVPEILREPFRALRTSLQLSSLDRHVGCLTVTSAIPGEGKSTIVRNLALTYQEWGMNVVVVEADLRRPTLSRFFGATSTEVGLTSVLTGEVTLDEALVQINVDNTSLEYLAKVRGKSTARSAAGSLDATATAIATKLALLPGGAAPPNPQAVLSTDTTKELIEQLRKRFDMVLIDTPPLLAVTDAVPLISHSDGVILVSRIGLSDRGSAERVIQAANRVPNVEILGVVANDLPSELGGGYGYGYSYGYSTNGAKAAR
jgi:polysaccharide biosynthesis transport protein